MAASVRFLLIIVGFTLASLIGGCDCSECEDAKPNLAIPAYVTIPNPYNGTTSYYRNEWYYCQRFAEPWDCYYNCFEQPTGFLCNGWNGQQGYFYWGQCIPDLVEGDVVEVRSYITNIAAQPSCSIWCGDKGGATAKPSTTRIIVRDPSSNQVDVQDKQTKELKPGEWDVFRYTITLGENGATTYEIITDFHDDVDETNENDNTGDVPGLVFN
jgi:hypothetical protein